jgi:uncharacterized protein YndB with AHSA1/START domain
VPDRSVAHGSFTIEREYPVPPERIWEAHSSAEAKQQWFAVPDHEFIGSTESFTLDFREGGTEVLVSRLHDGRQMRLESRFWDVVPNERFVATYDCVIGDRRLSVSLYSVQLIPTETGTKFITVEDGAFLDGLDSEEGRVQGVTYDLDNLGKYLERTELVGSSR